eukprot:maker-scaffold565_size135592-snap-gene-0.23 protein:Tk01866 transcript:maker-scaffold565_size135592-snap-gene-0.23-mRNA-1 annotation:"predicted protein"
MKSFFFFKGAAGFSEREEGGAAAVFPPTFPDGRGCLEKIIDHPSLELEKTNFQKFVSIQRKRDVIACFRQNSLDSLPLYSAINIFLQPYSEFWLASDDVGQEFLIDHLPPSLPRCISSICVPFARGRMPT